MESVVPPQITAELTQILSNLVLGDNEIRAKYVFPHAILSNRNRSCILVQKKLLMSGWHIRLSSTFWLLHSLQLQQAPKW
jgi:hypothetical protein